jgi:hypothetical protein
MSWSHGAHHNTDGVKSSPAAAFEVVKSVGLSLPGVEAGTKYDGSPVLRAGGCFMAGLATHPSAEPDSLAVRVDLDEREWLLDDAPETYYVTDYYLRYPIVLVRLAHVTRDALRDLLTVSHRLALAKSRRRNSLSRRSQAKAD